MWSKAEQCQYHYTLRQMTHTQQMPEPVAKQSVLILDDNPNDALLTRQLLLALPTCELTIAVHYSINGIFPADKQAVDWILLSQGYANSALNQLLDILLVRYPNAEILYLCDTEPSPQLLVDAAHAGLSRVLDKRSLSKQQLEQALSARATATGIHARHTAEQASPASELKPEAGQLVGAMPAPDSMLEQLATGVIRLQRSTDGLTLLLANRAACALEQLDPSAPTGQPFTAGQLKYDNFDLHDALQGLAAGQSRQYPECLHINEDGTPDWRTIVVTALDEGLYQLEISDTSEQLAQEREEHFEDAVWRDVVVSNPDLSAVLSEDGQIIKLLSDHWSRVRSDPQSLQGETLSSLLSEEHRQAFREALSKTLNTGKAQQMELLLDQGDSPVRWLARVAPLRGAAGSQRNALFTATDISELYEAQSLAQAELAVFREFSRRAPFGFVIKDMDGRFERVNPYFLDLFGLRSDDILGKTEADVFPSELASALRQLESRMLAARDVVEARIAAPAGNGAMFHWIQMPLHSQIEHSQASCLVVMESDGTLAGNPDSTASNQPEMAERPTQQRKKKTLSKRSQANIEELVTGIANDFNELMLSISSQAQQALAKNEPQAIADLSTRMASMLESSRHAHELIVKMLSYRSAEMDRPRSADLSESAQRSLQLLQHTVGNKVDLKAQVAEDLYAQEHDVIQLQKLLIQLFHYVLHSITQELALSQEPGGPTMVALLEPADFVQQQCTCCNQIIDGQYLDIAVADQGMQESGLSALALASAIANDPGLERALRSLHEQAQLYNGHVMLQQNDSSARAWHVLLPLTTGNQEGLQLDNTIPLKKYRDRRRGHPATAPH